MKGALALRNPVGIPLVNINPSNPVGSGAYVELTASLDKACSAVTITQTSTVPVYLAKGQAGEEVDVLITPNGSLQTWYPIELKKGERLSMKTATGTANTGSFILQKFQ